MELPYTLNVSIMLAHLAGVPAALSIWLPRARTAIVYTVGNWSFVGWSLTAIAIGQI